MKPLLDVLGIHPMYPPPFLREVLCGGWPGGVVIVCTLFLSGPGFTGLDTRHGYTHRLSSHDREHPTYKIEEDWHRCQFSNNFPPAKRGRLATDVSSVTIFLRKKKRERFCKSVQVGHIIAIEYSLDRTLQMMDISSKIQLNHGF